MFPYVFFFVVHVSQENKRMYKGWVGAVWPIRVLTTLKALCLTVGIVHRCIN